MFEKELKWLTDTIEWQIKSHFHDAKTEIKSRPGSRPRAPETIFPEVAMFKKLNLTEDDYLIITLALCPHINATLMDDTIHKNLKNSGEFPQLGGVRGKSFRGFIPTGETAMFILAGRDDHKRIAAQKYFDESHAFAKRRILWLDNVPAGEPRMSGRLVINQDIVDQLLTGKISQPRFSMDFPAEYITTELEDSDLILDKHTREQLTELENWIKHQNTPDE
jgi:hypothetical protein